MQAYHRGGQPIGPYISQSGPYGQPQATYYTPYQYGYAPVGPPQPVPFPPGYGPETYEPAPPLAPAPGGLSRPRQRPPHRQTSSKGTKELRGILKTRDPRDASSSAGHGDPMLSRSRTNSIPRQRANSSTRPELDTNPPFVPQHLFLTLDNTGELKIEGIAYQYLIDDLRERVLPIWPHGVIAEEGRSHWWRVQFAGRPWVSSREESILARRLLSQLFLVLSEAGYTYSNTVNPSGTPCRLVFSVGEVPEDQPPIYFFNICFSQSGHKISVLDAPPLLVQHLGRAIRGTFPHKVDSDSYKEGDAYTIRMKRGIACFKGADVDRAILHACILKFWKDTGYELTGCLPMGRKLSFGAKKEIWMFRGSVPRTTSIRSRRSVNEQRERERER